MKKRSDYYFIYIFFGVIIIGIILPFLIFRPVTVIQLNDYFKGISIPLFVSFFTFCKIFYRIKLYKQDRIIGYLKKVKKDYPNNIPKAVTDEMNKLQSSIDELQYYKDSGETMDKVLFITTMVGGFIGMLLYILK